MNPGERSEQASELATAVGPDGNRLAVPVKVRSPHFLYLADYPLLNRADVELVARAAIAVCRDQGLFGCRIQVVSMNQLSSAPGVTEAIERLLEPLREFGYDATPSISVCYWAAPHSDVTYSGLAFASLVLHTGSEPYVVKTFFPADNDAAGFDERSDIIVDSTRVICRGDAMIMDPTTPHAAFPLHPRDDSLLVLLQLELDDETAEARAALVAHLPPREHDSDHGLASSGIGDAVEASERLTNSN